MIFLQCLKCKMIITWMKWMNSISKFRMSIIMMMRLKIFECFQQKKSIIDKVFCLRWKKILDFCLLLWYEYNIIFLLLLGFFFLLLCRSMNWIKLILMMRYPMIMMINNNNNGLYKKKISNFGSINDYVFVVVVVVVDVIIQGKK